MAAGGIFDGRGVAAALVMGAGAVWVGTRFVTARESAASKLGKKALVVLLDGRVQTVLTNSLLRIIDAGFEDTMRSTLWTGRPLRALATPYIRDWELRRREAIEKLQTNGQIVMDYELDRLAQEGKLTDEIEEQATQRYVGGPVI